MGECANCHLTRNVTLAEMPTYAFGLSEGTTVALCVACMGQLLAKYVEEKSGASTCNECGDGNDLQCMACRPTGCTNCETTASIDWCDNCHECDHDVCESPNECTEQHADCVECGMCLVPAWEGYRMKALCETCAQQAAENLVAEKVAATAPENGTRSEDGAIEYADGMTVVFRN